MRAIVRRWWVTTRKRVRDSRAMSSRRSQKRSTLASSSGASTSSSTQTGDGRARRTANSSASAASAFSPPDSSDSDCARLPGGRADTGQAFEFTYELAVKTVRRRLAQIVSNPDALRGMDFADMMRDAAGASLVRDAPDFMRYRDMRNGVPHTCNAERTEETVAAMDEFLRDTRVLLAALQGRDGAAD